MRVITAIMGDGIGPEVMESAMRVVDATGAEIKWERVLAGMTALTEKGSPLPEETKNSIITNGIALKGPCDTPIGGGFKSVNVALRKEFDLYTNIRPIKSMPGVESYHRNVNLVICRENVQDIYAGEESGNDDRGTITGFITRGNSERFFNRVFEYAQKNGRSKVTIVHKATIIKYAYGLFLKVGLEVAKRYPNIMVEDKIVDNMAMQLVLDPHRFDVIAAPNMFGDILSDLCAGLIGGLGLAPGANIGDRCAIFEAVHGTAPDIAGKNIANPTALILSAAMMLDHIGGRDASRCIRAAVRSVYESSYVTKDIIGKAGVHTMAMTDAIVNRVSNYRDMLSRRSSMRL